MTEVNSNRVFQYQPDRNKYRNAQTVFESLDGKTDLIEYVDHNGQIIHTITMPQAWKTLGAINGCVNRMLTDGISYAQAVSSMRLSKQSNDMGRYGKSREFKLQISDNKLVLFDKTNDNAATIANGQTVAIRITAKSNYNSLVKRANDILNAIANHDQPLFVELVESYLPKTITAIAGAYQIELDANATIHDARARIVSAMSTANDSDYSILDKVELVKSELLDYIAWYIQTVKSNE